jgi:hypothetical protein
MAGTCPGHANDVILLPDVRTNGVFDDLIVFPSFSSIFS